MEFRAFWWVWHRAPCLCVCAQLFSCVRLFVTPWTAARQAPLSMGFSRQEYWSGVPCFPTQGSNPGFPNCRQIIYYLSHQRSPFKGYQFSSVPRSCLTLCSPMDCSIPGLPVHCQFSDFTQTHVHWVRDAIQPSHPLHPLLLPSIFPSISVFSNESVLCIRWQKYWSFSFNISPSN